MTAPGLSHDSIELTPHKNTEMPDNQGDIPPALPSSPPPPVLPRLSPDMEDVRVSIDDFIDYSSVARFVINLLLILNNIDN